MSDILDDRFHFCALRAYLEQAAIEQGQPSIEATRQRAFRYYEEALATKHAAQAELAEKADRYRVCQSAASGAPSSEVD